MTSPATIPRTPSFGFSRAAMRSQFHRGSWNSRKLEKPRRICCCQHQCPTADTTFDPFHFWPRSFFHFWPRPLLARSRSYHFWPRHFLAQTAALNSGQFELGPFHLGQFDLGQFNLGQWPFFDSGQKNLNEILRFFRLRPIGLVWARPAWA